jgi:hypothetical protein
MAGTPTSGLEFPPTEKGSTNSVLESVRDSEPVVLFDTNDPRALLNLLPATVRKAIEDAMFDASNAELFAMDEMTLYKYIKDSPAAWNVTPTDNRIRLKWWMEYDFCQATMARGMEMKRVIAGVCTHEFFYRRYLNVPYKVAWLLCPPTGYAIKVNEALEFSLEQMRDILSQPHVRGGIVDTKLGELKAKIHAMLDVRVKGAPMQKTMNINAQLSGAAAGRAVMAATAQPSMEQLERRMRELETRERELLNGGEVRTIEIKKV